MNRLEVSTVVYVSTERAYEFLLNFPGYADYTEYIDEVRQYGDGTDGTRYEIDMTWWVLSYTLISIVTAVDPPHRIDWEIEAMDIDGYWQIEELSPSELESNDLGSRIRIVADIDTDSIATDSLGIPPLVPYERVWDRLVPVARDELEQMIGRIVADLEGTRREVTLVVHEMPPFVRRRTS